MPAMPNPRVIRVLSISDDQMVRSTREMVLRRDGYEIISLESNEFLSIPEIRSFDVALICYSVPAQRAIGIIDRLRRYKPDIRVLRVNPRVARVEPYYDVDLEVLAGPAALLNAVRQLLEKSAVVRGGAQPEGRDEYCGPFPAVPWSCRELQRT
jgi:DNA-binding NtrC family response regulator